MPDDRRGVRPAAGRASRSPAPQPEPLDPPLRAPAADEDAELPLPSDNRPAFGVFAPYVERIREKVHELNELELSEEQLIQFHRMAFGALAGLTALQAAAPRAVPPLWGAFVSQPILNGFPTGNIGFFSYLLGAALWLAYAAYFITLGALLRRTESGWPYRPLQAAGLALVPFFNLYGSWVLFSETATRLERELQLRGRARQVKAAVGGALALAVLGWLLQLAADLGAPIPAIAPEVALYGEAAARLAALGLTYWMVHRLIRRFAEEGGGLDPTALAEAGMPIPVPRGPGAPSPRFTVWVVATLFVAGVAIRVAFSGDFECPSGTSMAATKDGSGRRVLLCEQGGIPHGPWRARGRNGAEQYSYSKGAIAGPYRSWDANGTLRVWGSYNGQSKEGQWVSFNERGVKLSDESYLDNALHGQCSKFHPNGNLAVQAHYAKGKLNGKYVAYHDTGAKAEEGAYQDGNKVGRWTAWSAQGLVTEERDYTPAKPASGAPAASAPGSPAAASPETEPAAPEIHVVTEKRLFAGRTPEWWGERLTRLKQQAESGPGGAKVYALTKRRAEQNGLEVEEGPEVKVRIAGAPPKAPPPPQGDKP